MSITTIFSNDEKALTITIKGHFDESLTADFMTLVEGITDKPIAHYFVDLKDTMYIDSTGLGLLLVLRDHTDVESDLTIKNCSADILEIFKRSTFDSYFRIE